MSNLIKIIIPIIVFCIIILTLIFFYFDIKLDWLSETERYDYNLRNNEVVVDGCRYYTLWSQRIKVKLTFFRICPRF